MISCFPDPYPDELIYSLCARFHRRMQFPNLKVTLHELFSSSCSTATIDLPCHLGNLISKLPPNHRYSDDKLIDEHTLLPFFSQFLPHKRTIQLREDMRGSGGLKIHKTAGLMASRIPTPRWLCFCPLCIDEDRKLVGQTYWHRLHQIPGVEVCAVHNTFLESSKARRDASRNNIQFIPAEEAVRLNKVRHLDQSIGDHRVLLKIARDAAWLLNHPISNSNQTALYNRYLKLLINRGLATYTGSIHVSKLLSEFRSYYSPALLKLLHCEFTGSDQLKTNWLLRLVRRSKYAQHPLYHLLLIQFLGCTVEEFFQLPEELNPFGDGPWPCLNPAASHYRQLVITECRLNGRLRYGRPTGRFSCKCGFAYARMGPDSSLEDRFSIGRMISFGQVWETKLKEFWYDLRLSLSEIGRRLGVDPVTVRRHAVQLKLPISFNGRKTKPLNSASLLKSERTYKALQKKRRINRSEWLYVRRQNPKVTMKALRHRLSREYKWLLQNDREWLKKHSPRSRSCIRSTSSIDWRRRDAECVVAVKEAASSLKNVVGRPIQITKTAIGRAIGAVTLLQQKLHNMPLTAQVLDSLVETREQYALRRIHWATDCYRQEHILPQEWQLVQRASVYSLRGVVEIRSAIKAAIRILKLELAPEKLLSAKEAV